MSATRIQYLVKLYFDNTITVTEKAELFEWVVKPNNEQEVSTILREVWANYQTDKIMPAEMSDEIIASFFKQETAPEITKKSIPVISLYPKRKWWKLTVAAACIMLLISSVYLFVSKTKNTPIAKNDTQKQQLINDVKPGGQKAVLTLSDGVKIVLDSASNGVIAQQGNTQITKLINGHLSYHTNGISNNVIAYNTMSTPAGGMYLLVLPDGSKVWLNSASSIRYPTEFKEKERLVQITGEAYFEVAKNENMPFIVKINNDAAIRVLGTHFNVNAYEDEGEIKTTLLEGAINITQGSKSNLLKPGQQAQINKGGRIKLIDDADTDEAVAWKNGNFQFNSTSLSAVLRQASRWYDVEVVYEGTIPADKFSGKISRSVNLTRLLKWMEWSDIHFKLEGKKITVLP